MIRNDQRTIICRTIQMTTIVQVMQRVAGGAGRAYRSRMRQSGGCQVRMDMMRLNATVDEQMVRRLCV